jgi:hypothetical protein
MKVVIRSSSLLFTLLSIIFHVPIRRTTKQPDLESSSPGDQVSQGNAESNGSSSIESHREASLVLRGAGGNQFIG